jgi:hypothetical protein
MIDMRVVNALVEDGEAAVLADYLEERGHYLYEKCRRQGALETPRWCGDRRAWDAERLKEIMANVDVPAELAAGAWEEAFGYASDGEKACNSGVPDRALPNDLDTSVEPFTRKDVKRVIAARDGENDGADWVVVGELKDGRFFCVEAGCDYTGWD